MVKLIIATLEDEILTERYTKHIPRKGEYIEYNNTTYEVIEVKWVFNFSTIVTLYVRDILDD